MSTLYEKILSEHIEKGYQLRIVVSEFKEQYYLHIRKYFLSYEGEWLPSNEGISFIATLQSTNALLEAMLDILSKEEINTLLEKRLNEQAGGVS